MNFVSKLKARFRRAFLVNRMNEMFKRDRKEAMIRVIFETALPYDMYFLALMR